MRRSLSMWMGDNVDLVVYSTAIASHVSNSQFHRRPQRRKRLRMWREDYEANYTTLE